MKKLHYLIFFIFLSAAYNPVVCRAAEGLSWLADKKRLEEAVDNLPNEQRCQSTWDILWPWAKRGNLNARALLLADFYLNGRTMPGTKDQITFMRDLTILTVHSTGVEGDQYKEIMKEYYKMVSNILLVNNPFSKCVAKSPSKSCATFAVEGLLVPSFEGYASEIENRLSRGQKSLCRGGYESVLDKSSMHTKVER